MTTLATLILGTLVYIPELGGFINVLPATNAYTLAHPNTTNTTWLQPLTNGMPSTAWVQTQVAGSTANVTSASITNGFATAAITNGFYPASNPLGFITAIAIAGKLDTVATNTLQPAGLYATAIQLSATSNTLAAADATKLPIASTNGFLTATNANTVLFLGGVTLTNATLKGTNTSLPQMLTSSNGLPAGSLYSSNNVLRIR